MPAPHNRPSGGRKIVVDPATVNLTRVDKNAVMVAANTTQTRLSSLVVLVVMTTETHRKEKSRYIRLHPPPKKKHARR